MAGIRWRAVSEMISHPVKLRECIGDHDKSAIRLACLGRNQRLNGRHIVHRRNGCRHAEGGSGRLKRGYEAIDKRRRRGAKKHCGSRRAGRDFLDELSPLPAKARVRWEQSPSYYHPVAGDSRSIQCRRDQQPIRKRQGWYEWPLQHRCSVSWRGAREGAQGLVGSATSSLCTSLHQLDIRRSPSHINRNVAADSPTCLLQSLNKRGEPALPVWVVGSQMHQYANAPHAFALLRLDRQGRCGRHAAEKRYKLPSSHWVASRSDSQTLSYRSAKILMSDFWVDERKSRPCPMMVRPFHLGRRGWCLQSPTLVTQLLRYAMHRACAGGGRATRVASRRRF